jgi:glycosyltransferase involved in cell wall biosynthesis
MDVGPEAVSVGLAEPALSIVVPVYNGAHTVSKLVEALSGLEVPGGIEIVLVVDGSPDDSLKVCRRLCEEARKPLTVVNLSRNFGEHNAVMAGLGFALGEHIVTMDDDLQNPPGEVLRLWQHAIRGGYDVVYSFSERKGDAAWRNLGSCVANWIADMLMDKPKGLYLSSFRCMNRFTAREVAGHRGPYPYVDGLIMQVTRNIGTLQVTHLPRTIGRSNYTVRRLARLFFSIVLNFSVTPLRVASVVGFGLAMLGALGVLLVVGEAIIVGTPRGWASLMAAVLLLAGVQLMMLGLVGEYVGRLFLTVNGKPQFVVRDVQRGAPNTPATP